MNKYLEKIAGNRLVRHIAENRENFPLSRLLGLAEKGVLKTPEQLLPGRNFGANKQFVETSKKHGLKPREGDWVDDGIVYPGTSTVDRRVLSDGQYRSRSLQYDDGTKMQHIAVPPLYDPIPGNHVENLRRLHDTHINNHETFEMDEGFRLIDKGFKRPLPKLPNISQPSEDFRTATHWSPAVLLRESRDMSSNPYAHVGPPSTNLKAFSALTNEAKRTGANLQTLMTQRRLAPTDISSLIPMARLQTGESGLVKALQGGKPYQSNPTSSDIRRARNTPHAESEALTDKVKGNLYNRVKMNAQLAHDTTRGNPAYRN